METLSQILEREKRLRSRASGSSSPDEGWTAEEIAAAEDDFIAAAEEVCPGFRVDDDNRAVLRSVFNYCMGIPGELDPGKGLWLYGTIGSGKSTVLEVVKRFGAAWSPRDSHGPRSFRIISAKRLNAAFSSGGYAALDSYAFTPHQAIDDLGMEALETSHFGATENVVAYVLATRYDRRRGDFTHVTTNLAPRQIAECYGERVYDRCREMFNFVKLEGPTRRG
jgi:hypothetical protein